MSLSEWIDRHAGTTPGKVAIRFPGRDLSYAALAALVNRIAAALAATSVGRGDCVAYLGQNTPESLALLFACAKRGALFMPMNWRLAPPEHKQLLADCRPRVLVATADFVQQIDTFRPELQDVTLVSLDPAPADWLEWEAFLDRAAPPPSGQQAQTPADDDPPLLICYTSGSTGTPKGALLSAKALAWNALNSIDMHALTPDDRILTTLPLFHVGGLNNQTTPALFAGCTVVLHPRFDVDASFDAIEHERITLAVLVPSQLQLMMASPRWHNADLSTLRMITTGSMIVSTRLIEAVLARGIPLVQVYGTTETCPIAACQKAEEARSKAGSAGRAARHCALRVIDAKGDDVPPDTIGEVLVRGPNLMSGYWNNPRATAAALVDGWFHTGDMGHMDQDGFLYIDGRRKELIISGGENIYPAEIELLLTDLPGVAEAAVVGVPNERWGEMVVAVIVPARGVALSREQVNGMLEGRIARFKLPKEVVFVDQLPRTALGKIRKEEVRRLVARHSHMEHI